MAAIVVCATAAVGQRRPEKAEPYYPTRFEWATRLPEEVGMNSARLQEVVRFAEANAGNLHLNGDSLAVTLASEPYNEIVGPTNSRGPHNGMVIKNGYLVLEWGDTERVDWTFSATKSYLATMVGLAYDAGLIKDLTDPVRRYAPDSLFAQPHNAQITWEQLLQQRSEWQGTLWGKPDWADRYDPKTGRRPVRPPGSTYTYNDVRVNLAGLAALHVWRRPLPQVFREMIMDPIQASTTWRWHGYRNSWIDIDGLRVQSVAGGGHWGGGMWISTRDHARFGLLHLRRGKWAGRQLLSERWIDLATTPSPTNPNYGFMWWLNTAKRQLPAAPEKSFFAAGGGGNYVWIDSEHDLVVVIRWIPNLNGVLEKVLAALEPAYQGGQ
jgi:CubicO group peptidase (beta-lactamase class C family)